jgi:excisionase family DNA binding protein
VGHFSELAGWARRIADLIDDEEGWSPAMSTKTVFTTGEAAKICKVSQQTIIRCFDNGSLKGFRVPGSRFRRIPRDQLFSFMKDNGIPTDALESGKRKILVVDDDEELVELLVDVFERDGRFETRNANNGFGAGMLVKEFRPDLVVLDVMLPDINGKEVCQRVRSDSSLESVKIICISGMVEQDKIADLRAVGADDFMHKPFTVDKLLERACDLLEIERVTAG